MSPPATNDVPTIDEPLAMKSVTASHCKSTTPERRLAQLSSSRIALLVALTLSAIGCNDGRPVRVPIAGTVLIDGKPLEKAFVKVVPVDGRPSIGETNADGRFSLTCYEPNDGATRGTHKVAVIAVTEISGAAIMWRAPKKYSSIDSSGLQLAVDTPKDDVEIRITWDGGKPYIERFGRGTGD